MNFLGGTLRTCHGKVWKIMDNFGLIITFLISLAIFEVILPVDPSISGPSQIKNCSSGTISSSARWKALRRGEEAAAACMLLKDFEVW